MKTPLILFTFVAVLLLTWLALPELSLAQASPPPPPEKPTQTPIDGGLALLAAAGGAYAVRKLRHRDE